MTADYVIVPNESCPDTDTWKTYRSADVAEIDPEIDDPGVVGLTKWRESAPEETAMSKNSTDDEAFERFRAGIQATLDALPDDEHRARFLAILQVQTEKIDKQRGMLSKLLKALDKSAASDVILELVRKSAADEELVKSLRGDPDCAEVRKGIVKVGGGSPDPGWTPQDAPDSAAPHAIIPSGPRRGDGVETSRIQPKKG